MIVSLVLSNTNLEQIMFSRQIVSKNNPRDGREGRDDKHITSFPHWKFVENYRSLEAQGSCLCPAKYLKLAICMNIGLVEIINSNHSVNLGGNHNQQWLAISYQSEYQSLLMSYPTFQSNLNTIISDFIIILACIWRS